MDYEGRPRIVVTDDVHKELLLRKVKGDFLSINALLRSLLDLDE